MIGITLSKPHLVCTFYNKQINAKIYEWKFGSVQILMARQCNTQRNTCEYYVDSARDDLVPGYVQYIVQDPFIIHLYTKEQIEIFKLFKNDNTVLNIDVTGSIIRRAPMCKK